MSKSWIRIFLVVILIIISSLSLIGQGAEKIKVIYWEKWTGFEQKQAEYVVNEFNKTQDKFEVVYTPVENSTIIPSLMSGNAPDILGGFQKDPIALGSRGLLLPLDSYMKEAGLKKSDFVPVFWDYGFYDNHLYGVFSSGESWLMYYNKDMFKAAGLDPNKPPATMEELREYNKKLTKKDANGKIIQMGFDFRAPGNSWDTLKWSWFWGATLYDEKTHKFLIEPQMIKAYEWMQSFVKDFGVQALQLFESGFGEWGTASEPFLAGKIAMEFNGPWTDGFIQRLAPNLNYGVAPWPSAAGVAKGGPIVFADTDTLMIPKQAKHPKEAFEFLKFMCTEKGQFLLNSGPNGRGQPSVLRKYSKEYITQNSNKNIMAFIDALRSPNTRSYPRVPTIDSYMREMDAAFDEILNLKGKPEDILKTHIKRAQDELDKFLASKR